MAMLIRIAALNNHKSCVVVSPSPPPLNREVREEPEKIKKWREEQIKRLEEKGEFLYCF
jgi:hypothetical protein